MTNKTTFLTTVILSSILLTSGLVGSIPATFAHTTAPCTGEVGDTDCFINPQNPNSATTYTVTLTANGDLERTYDWTINKEVSQETIEMFVGDQATSTYTVSVEKDGGTDVGIASGDICVTNGGSYWTRDLAISVSVDNPNDLTSLGSADVDLSSAPFIAPDEQHCYAYEVEFETALADTSYRVVSSVTITNHSGNVGNVHEVNEKTSFEIPSEPSIIINDSINVDDTNGSTWATDGTNSWTYDRTFSCDDAGENPNTATIRETGLDSSALVTVGCYGLTVVKDADTSFTRDYDWTINKSSDISEINVQVNQAPVSVEYTIDLTATPVDSGFGVNGKITVTNPAPFDATLTGVSDTLSNNVKANVDCPSLTVPANGELVCTYNSPLDDATSLTNTATATLQNTPSGTTDFSGNTDVVFGDPTTELDKCVTLSDDNSEFGSDVEVCHDSITQSVYSKEFGSAEPYLFTSVLQTSHTNTACIATDDGNILCDDVTIPIVVGAPPQEDGCTLTIGYWKAHSNPEFNGYQHFGEHLGGLFGDGQVYVLGDKPIASPQEAYDVFTSAQGNDQVAKVEAQLLAVLLNAEAGADTTAVDQTISDAQDFLNNVPTNKKELRSQSSALIDSLSAYNEGSTGPEHCTE